MADKFKYIDPNLTEEHIKQIARFVGGEYKEGEYQKWNKYAQFKRWHKKLMDERDNNMLSLKKGGHKKRQ